MDLDSPARVEVGTAVHPTAGTTAIIAYITAVDRAAGRVVATEAVGKAVTSMAITATSGQILLQVHQSAGAGSPLGLLDLGKPSAMRVRVTRAIVAVTIRVDGHHHTRARPYQTTRKLLPTTLVRVAATHGTATGIAASERVDTATSVLFRLRVRLKQRIRLNHPMAPPIPAAKAAITAAGITVATPPFVLDPSEVKHTTPLTPQQHP